MFTLAFPGDLRQFKGNPFKTETPFGVPVSAALGDVLEERGRLLEEREQLLALVRSVKIADVNGRLHIGVINECSAAGVPIDEDMREIFLEWRNAQQALIAKAEAR